MEEVCRQEVVRMHQIIEAWLSGNVARNAKAFAAFQDALAADFHLVHPTGAMRDKTGVTSAFWQAHGAMNAPFRIEIRNLACHFVQGSCCLMTYEEWQYGHETTARLSTALFRQPPHHQGVEWLHLHETWLPHQGQTDV